MLINTVSITFLAIASLLYLLLIASHVPDQYALTTNFMLVPFLFGCAGYFVLKGSLFTKLILLTILPLVHVLYFGADDTKPGLENMIALGELVFVYAGAVLVFLVKKYLAG